MYATRMCGGRTKPMFRYLAPRWVSKRKLLGVDPATTPWYRGVVFDAFGVGVFWEYGAEG